VVDVSNDRNVANIVDFFRGVFVHKGFRSR
jgi:hypothetical protein